MKTVKTSKNKLYLFSAIVLTLGIIAAFVLKSSVQKSTINLLVEDAGNGVVVTQTQAQDKTGHGATVTNTQTGQKVKIKAKNQKDLDDRVTKIADKMTTKNTTTSTTAEKKLSDTEICNAQGGTLDDKLNPGKCVKVVPVTPDTTIPPIITSIEGKTCKGGNSLIGSNQWALTGYGLTESGERCTSGSSCTKKRECIKCNIDGTWGATAVCGEGDALNYVAPAYESKANGGTKNQSCWKNGTWYSDATVTGGANPEYCSNGKWVTSADFLKAKDVELCGGKGTYTLATNSCGSSKETVEVLFSQPACNAGLSSNNTVYTECNKDNNGSLLKKVTMCYSPKVFKKSASGQYECVAPNGGNAAYQDSSCGGKCPGFCTKLTSTSAASGTYYCDTAKKELKKQECLRYRSGYVLNEQTGLCEKSGSSSNDQQSSSTPAEKNPDGKTSTSVIKGNTARYCVGGTAYVKDNVNNNIVNTDQCGDPGCNPTTGQCNPELPKANADSSNAAVNPATDTSTRDTSVVFENKTGKSAYVQCLEQQNANYLCIENGADKNGNMTYILSPIPGAEQNSSQAQTTQQNNLSNSVGVGASVAATCVGVAIIAGAASMGTAAIPAYAGCALIGIGSGWWRNIYLNNNKDSQILEQTYSKVTQDDSLWKSVAVDSKNDCPNPNAAQHYNDNGKTKYLCYDPDSSTYEVVNPQTKRRVKGESCSQAHQCDSLYCRPDGVCDVDPGHSN